jgi:hypothetical protein
MIDTKIDKGIEITTISVLRHEPRKSRIINPVNPAAMPRLDQHAMDRAADEDRLVGKERRLERFGQRRHHVGQACLDAVDDVECLKPRT